MSVDWEQLLTIDCGKVAELFVQQKGFSDTKIQVRGYTLPFVGTQQKWDALLAFLRKQLLKYVFPEQERPDNIDWALARDKFGNNDPEKDGKLGEMLLYVFVEAFLKTPLMAYKLKDLSNPNDQVKGADGVFIGEYQGQKALLIGESKIHKTLASAIKSTLESLQRFHDNAAPYANELLVAKKYPKERGLKGESLDTILAILDRSVDHILVHPVFVSYDLGKIGEISEKSNDSYSAENALREILDREVTDWKTKIIEKKNIFPKPFQVFLDFFFLPVEDTLNLRKHFYELLHGHPYIGTKANGINKGD